MSKNAATDSPRAMTGLPNFEQLLSSFGQCLGRIDAHAYRLQADPVQRDDGTADAIEQETEALEDVVGSLLQVFGPTETSDLNAVLGRTLGHCVRGLPGPVLVRQRIDPNLPLVACEREQLTGAVQRALRLGAEHLATGDELRVGTRVDGASVLLEIEACGGGFDPHLAARAQTLCEFTDALRGHCRVAQDARHHLLIAVELPLALVADDS